MKILIIYNSKTGFSKRYAEWIGEELSCEVKDYKQISEHSLDGVDLLIYGSRVHAETFYGVKKIKNLARDKKCKLIVFATGASPADMKDQIAEMWKRSEKDDTIPHFYMQSGLCYEKMGPLDKLMMKIFVKILKSKKEKTQMDIDMTRSVDKSFDVSSKDFIKPLVEYVRNMDK